jgi:dihydrodipicolinate synthase/N-acetylneuraminate lyase
MHSTVHGVIPAIPAFFTGSGEIDFEQMCRCIDFVSASGCSGIAVSMIGGEFYKMNSQERVSVYTEAVDHCRSGIKVYAGVSHSGTVPAMKLAMEAERAGVDFIVIMPPYYNPFGSYSPPEIARHYIEVGTSTELPFIVQDFNYGIPLKLLKRLQAECSNFAGIKVEGKSKQAIVARMKTIRQSLGEDTMILGGMLGCNSPDEIIAGSSGTVPGSALPDHIVPLYSRGPDDEDAAGSYMAVRNILQYEEGKLQYFSYLEEVILKYRGITESTYCRMPFSYPRKSVVDRLLGQLMESGIKAAPI